MSLSMQLRMILIRKLKMLLLGEPIILESSDAVMPARKVVTGQRVYSFW
jgi:hypothetical protein